MVTTQTAWAAVFAAHDDERATGAHNRELRDVPDSRIGRNCAEQPADSEAETPAEVDTERRRMGDPLAWWSRGRR